MPSFGLAPLSSSASGSCWNAIANHAPSLLCLVDADGRVRPLATNIAFERTLGYDPSESGGDVFWELYVPPEDADAVREAIEGRSARELSPSATAPG